MAIGDDFAIDYTNKRIYHSANNNTYTTRDFYSWLMDTFDESAQMDDQVPMKALTPNEFQIINEWFLDNGEGSEAYKYLKEGSIETVGYDGAIRLLKLESNSHTFTSGDIGKEVGYSGGSPSDTGTLLAYDNTLDYIWIRTTASFSDTSTTLDLDDSTSIGNIIDTNGSLTGEEVYANVYTLGTIETSPSPQVYIMQGTQTRIAEWSDKDNFDRGHVDVLVRVKEMGTEINNGEVTIYARQSGDLYDHFFIDLSGGGRNAVPLNTLDDGNDDLPDNYLLIDNVSGGTPTVGDVIYHPTSGDVEWYAEIVSASNIASGEYLLGLKGLRKIGSADIQDNDACGNGTWTANANGTEGDAYFDYTPGTDFTTDGQVLTQAMSGAKAIQRGHSTAGDTVVCEVDSSQTGSNRDAYYIDFDTTHTVTGASDGSAVPDNYARGVAGFSDVTIAHINGTVTISNKNGTFIPGERITWNAGASEAIYITDNGSTMTLANVDPTDEPDAADSFTGDLSGATADCDSGLTDSNSANFAFEQQSAYPYNVFVEGGSIYNAGRTLLQIYAYLKYVCRDGSTFAIHTSDGSSITIIDGQQYRRAVSTYTEKKQAPYGTFAGGTFFGAQGVWLQGMDSSDANNIQLTDANAVERTPYTSVVIKVTNTVSGDKVAVYLDDGSGGIDKDTYTSHASNNSQSDNTLEIQESIPVDTPSAGHVVVVAVDENQEHIYRYTSWSGSTFTLMTERTGSGTSGSSGNTLVDSAATFSTWGIQYGDIIRNTTDGTWGYVVSVDSETQLTTVTGFGSNTLDWDSGDNYEIGSLIQTYDGSDTVYVPYILTKATGTSVEKTILYNTDRDVIVRARNVEAATPILPFETSSTITSGGMTVAVIRTEDTIYQ